MKKGIILCALFFLAAATRSSAQVSDDVYFDPAKDRVQPKYQTSARERYPAEGQPGNYSDEQNAYVVEDEYDYYNDYDYYYTSRIRRFHRPYYGFGFFDPVYVDTWHYDPFLAPGVTVLIYDDLLSNRAFSRWNRWNRLNNWGPGVNINISMGWNPWNRWNSWDPWGWNSWGSWNTWNNWGWNSWNSFNRFGWNNWGFGGPYWFGGGSFACPPTWGNGFAYNTIVNIQNDQNIHYGPRGGGSATGPAPGASPGRGPGVIDNAPGSAPRTVNTVGGRLPETARVRTPAATGNSGDINNPGERTSPAETRENIRYPDRYPRNIETASPDTRIPANTRTPATERATPSNPNSPGTRSFPSYDPGRNNTYDRPRNIDAGVRTAPSAPAPRSNPNTTQTPPRTYTPSTRSYERSGDSYTRPRTPANTQGNTGGFSQPRNTDSGFGTPRNSSPSGGSINNAPARSSGNPSGNSSSSSSGGRTRN
ncbi:MAG: hypothetical protein ACOYOO_05720 [Saprospiraceae bacterium]|jgi:hypothetical protein